MAAIASHPSRTKNRRWNVIAVFFIFLLLHQCDKLLIGPLQTADHGYVPHRLHPMGVDQHRRPDRRLAALPAVGLAERQIQPGSAAVPGGAHLGLHHLVERYCSQLRRLSGHPLVHRHR